MAEIILPIVVEKLASLIHDEIGLLWGVTKEMEKLTSTFSTIQAVLEDAERKQHLQETKAAIKDWLRKLKYASYEVDDILDDFVTEAIRLKYSRSKKKVCLPASFLTSCYPVVGNSVFRHKIGKRMRDVMERLEQIANERNNYHLVHIPVDNNRVGFSKGRETGSHLTEPQVYGREEEKEKIVKVLINDVADFEHLSVYPIIGMGGLGKTTLAQLVYNDDRVVNHFEKRIWVCVSEDFEERKILKEIIESETKKLKQNTSCENLSLDRLQVRLREMLKGKRYLLVLDDVWNEDQEKWNKLKGVLKGCGSRGASIITTTRLNTVALIMGTLPPHQLLDLSKDDCWLLFKQYAFGSEGEEHPNLVPIGQEIVKKCGGVPLAAKTLGSLLRFNREERQWDSIRDSEIWKLPQGEKSILPALRLSYYNLPLELKRCFAYCAVFEKDTIMEKNDVIRLWMANGFISSTNQNREIEDIGNEIWNELHCRSFFQDAKKDEFFSNEVTFTMHDLLHDLAQSVMDEECQIVEDDRATNNMSSKRVRHLNLIARSKPFTTIPKELHFADSLRTLIYTDKYNMQETNSSELSIFENYSALRAFATSGNDKNLASSIGGLKHLRYSRLGGSGITTLPDSICNLWNLQTLNLEDCPNLERLPEKMRCLRNLRHLLLSEFSCLIEMPPFIGELTCLKTLSTFVVDNKKRKGCGLDELQCLNKLRGSLRIENLERVGNWMDAKKANLIAKQNLHSLRLYWDNSEEEYDSQENVEQLLEALQPHPNLQKLVIYYFKGTHFPLWMMKNYSSNLKSIVSLSLLFCKNCIQLPPLQQLPSLKTLSISDMNYVEYMMINDDDDDNNNNNNNYQVQDGHRGGNAVRGIFRSLETLIVHGLPNLKGLSNDSNEEEGRGFQSLVLFPRLRKLWIVRCPKLMTNLPLPCFPALEELEIRDHPELTSDILSNWLESLTSLRSLRIENCHKLTSITANYFRNLTKLQKLSIYKCPELTKRYKKGSGEDWHMIAHIPHVTVEEY